MLKRAVCESDSKLQYEADFARRVNERILEPVNLPTELHTFDGVPEALGGGGVVWRRVEGVELQAVQHVLGLRQPLHHGAGHVASGVPPDGAGLGVWGMKTEPKVRGDVQ